METVAPETIAPVTSVMVPEMLPELPADCANDMDAVNERTTRIAEKTPRRIDVCIHCLPVFWPEFKNAIYERWAFAGGGRV